MSEPELIIFTQHEDGSVTADHFPSHIRIANELLVMTNLASWWKVDGMYLTINATNGSARYRLGPIDGGTTRDAYLMIEEES